MRSYANNLAGHSIRVNSVHPSAVRTPMVANEATGKWIEAYGLGDGMSNAIPVDLLDISHAVAWLVSDEARYVTGVSLPVDGGASNKK